MRKILTDIAWFYFGFAAGVITTQNYPNLFLFRRKN